MSFDSSKNSSELNQVRLSSDSSWESALQILSDLKTSPWTTSRSQVVYDNPWIQVREDQVIRPDGLPGIYGVVQFKNRAIGILPVDDDGSVWLVAQHRYVFGAGSWEIPMGGALENESLEDAARRELREETGFQVQRLELMGGVVHLSNSVTNEEAHIFRASGLIHGPSEPEGTEQIVLRRWDWSTVWRMVQDGVITDAVTIMALLREKILRMI